MVPTKTEFSNEKNEKCHLVKEIPKHYIISLFSPYFLLLFTSFSKSESQITIYIETFLTVDYFQTQIY
jgi:hypothetical protein